MESTDLTCATCGASWKLIKAGTDPVVCPYCKAPVEIAGVDRPSEAKPKEALAPTTAAKSVATAPAPAATVEPVPPPKEQPTSTAEEHSIPATVRVIDVPDSMADDYDDHVEPRRRRGMNPVAKTILILLLLIFLAPVALFIILFVVCVIAMAAR